MEVDEEDFEQPSSSDNKASKKRFEVKKVKWQYNTALTNGENSNK